MGDRDSSELNQKLDDMSAIELTGKIMVVAIIVLFLVVVFVFFLHLYAKWFWYRRQQDAAANGHPTRRRRRRFDFAPGHVESTATAALRCGLDPSVLKSIPILEFNPKSFKDGLECAVCLSDVSEGEKARLLPKCNHGFHVECIDMWFQSHSTCPLCRNPVSNQNINTPESPLETTEESSSVNGYSTESPNFPTNVLFWGNQNQVSTLASCLEEDDRQCPASSQIPCSSSSSSSATTIGNSNGNGMLVIDIPRQMNEEEEPKSPAMTRLRSLKRLLSRDRKVLPCSPSNVDVEQVG
ncbi:RING-H2 finger protein ATL3-like [Cornus florida]|uniref:RING-H2 finger protein ATL3-like n=1 Tax=Cornus florida TaxID=4283 RepID=UPI0028A10CCE|nr:RING-H2 finger protein ATL3-like [Cornus florida]